MNKQKEKYLAAKKAAEVANTPDGWMERIEREKKGMVITQLYRRDMNIEVARPKYVPTSRKAAEVAKFEQSFINKKVKVC